MRTLVMLTVAGVVAVLAPALNAAAAMTWTIDHVHTPPVANAELDATSCPTATFCVAVGATSDGTGADTSLVETSSDGSTWTRTASPNPAGASDAALRGVSCVSPSYCVALGEWYADGVRRSLIETWNGSSWRLTAHPDPDGQTSGFRSVSCATRTFCLAVGDSQTNNKGRSTLVEQWDGSSWAIVATPSVGTRYAALLDVDCSSATWCTAVGNGGDEDIDQEGAYLAVIESYDGTTWQLTTQSDGDIGTLHGVSCVSRKWCMAVGRRYAFQGGSFPTAETWDGSTWTYQPVPIAAHSIDDVSCTTPSFCALVGAGSSGNSYAATWGGRSVVSTPSPASVNLVGTSCARATSCIAVGSASRATIEHFDGTAWTLQAATNGRGDMGSSLSAVSCASATFCVAVGNYVDAAAVTEPLIETWDGTRWQPTHAPNPPGDGLASLESVSCTSPSWCVAAGHRAARNGGWATLLETWDGTSWTITAAPNHGIASAVSCVSASFCVAAAVRATEFWDGTSWTAVRLVGPGGADVSLNGIDCVGVDNCVVVGGYYGAYPDIEPTLVERWNGTSWHRERTPKGPSGNWNELYGVFCPSTSYCVAVGSSFDTANAPLIFTWNGSTWTNAPHAHPAQALRAVSCAGSGACVAVGTGQLVERLAAGTWTRESSSTPEGALGPPSYYGLDCETATACRLVGDYPRLTGTFALAESRS